MIPVLFEIGSLKVYSYGMMLGLAFLLGSWILARELKRKGMDPAIASTITVLAVIFGIAGAKGLFLIEQWDEFMRDPSMAFSPGGLTWYGGFLLALAAVVWYVRRKKVSLLPFLDALAVALILAYGVGRIGCHLAGDGDYGQPTRLPWGTIYANGTAKPTVMLAEYFKRNPDERAAWAYDSLRAVPGGRDRLGHLTTRFDEVTPLHPTPLYEFAMGILGFLVLLRLRKAPLPAGATWMIYLMLASIFRFAVEFLRLNPRVALGLSEAQLFAIGLFLAGLTGFLVLTNRAGRLEKAR